MSDFIYSPHFPFKSLIRLLLISHSCRSATVVASCRCQMRQGIEGRRLHGMGQLQVRRHARPRCSGPPRGGGATARCAAAALRFPARRRRCRYLSGGCTTAICAATATRFPKGRRRRGSPRGGGAAVPLAAVARRRCCGYPRGGGSATAPALGGGCSAVPRGGAPAPVRRRPVAAAPRAFSAMRSRRHWRSVCGAAAVPAALWQRGFPFVGWSQPRPTFPLGGWLWVLRDDRNGGSRPNGPGTRIERTSEL